MQFNKRVLFFTAGSIATAGELLQIDQLRQAYEHVLVRNGDVNVNQQYGAVGEVGRLEQADGLAGSIPASYLDDEDEVDTEVFPDGDVTPDGNDAVPEAIILIPSAPSIAANGGTVQMNAIAAEADDDGGVTQTLRNSGTGVSWESGTPAKATVSSSGLVTGANTGAGSTVITYTYDAGDDADPVVRTATVTLT